MRMPDPTIDVNLDWGTDPHDQPTVTNSTTQNNDIPATQTSLIWQVTPADDGVEITGVTFYRTQADKEAQTNAYTPPFLNTPGGHSGDDVTTWKIDFNTSRVASETTLWYDVQFKDDDFNDMDWDPRVTIKPRM
jgi:hypothetical protein